MVGSKINGVFLDIGAYDGRTRSNSYALAQMGWSGVLVEPSAPVFTELLNLHGKNSKLHLVQCLIGSKRGLVPFWPSRDGVSTSNKDHYEKWKDDAEFEPVVYVPQITVPDLIEELPVILESTVVSIDVEGGSAELFLGWPFELCRPEVFCVEYDDRASELASFADQYGYGVTYKSNENLVLVR